MTDRQITHAPGCWDWGPRHYGCALREIEALRAEVKRLKSMTAVTMGVGSGDGNLFVHGDCESIKAAQAIVLERGALRAEVERLAKAIAGLITWIPSAGTYRRLGFNPEAPMRALKEAKAVLRRDNSND